MTFEEFFKKKRIDLAAFEQGEVGLFSEFKTNYEQVGEKSFDHTKKYWFNKLRRQFPLAIEVKTEKAHISNPLAGQTITESLAETTTETPPSKLGFVPKFRAGNMPKPGVKADEKTEDTSSPPAPESAPPEKPAESAEAKPAYKPRFNMKNIPPKPTEEK
jgi:hypothetical protein